MPMSKPAEAAEPEPVLPSPTGQDKPLGKVREDAERDHILSILQVTHGRRGEAARILGISRKTLWKKLKHLGVS